MLPAANMEGTMPTEKTCPECGHTHTRGGITCCPDCKAVRDARAQRIRRANNVAGGAAPVPSPAPLRPPSTERLNEPTPDVLATLHASSLAIFRSLPYVESVTIHRDGHLSVVRAGPPGESVVDVLRDLGTMAGATKRKPAREM